MFKINELLQISNKKLEVCSELIADANNGNLNEEVIVFIGNHENILTLLHKGLNSQNINFNFIVMSIDSYMENQATNSNKNIILTISSYEQLINLFYLNKKALIIDVRRDNLKELKDSTIYHIIKGSDKYKRFNIKNENKHLVYMEAYFATYNLWDNI